MSGGREGWKREQVREGKEKGKFAPEESTGMYVEGEYLEAGRNGKLEGEK